VQEIVRFNTKMQQNLLEERDNKPQIIFRRLWYLGIILVFASIGLIATIITLSLNNSQEVSGGRVTCDGWTNSTRCPINTFSLQNEYSKNESMNDSTYGESCVAPAGAWGPVCTSASPLSSPYPDTLIAYSVYQAVPTTPGY